MEELVGRKIRVVLNSTYGIITSTGILMKIEDGFFMLELSTGKTVYLAINNIKTVELA
ncbi:MAG: hypothetical protein V1761_02480 [bacterium]